MIPQYKRWEEIEQQHKRHIQALEEQIPGSRDCAIRDDETLTKQNSKSRRCMDKIVSLEEESQGFQNWLEEVASQSAEHRVQQDKA